MKTESEVIREVGNYLAAKKYFFWRNVSTPVLGRSMPKYWKRGITDFILIKDGVVYGIECKRAGSSTEREKNGRKVRAGTLSPDQVQFGLDLLHNGGRHIVALGVEEIEAAGL